MQNYRIGYCDAETALITSTEKNIVAESIEQACIDFQNQNINEIYPFILINEKLSGNYSLRNNPNCKAEKPSQDRPKNTTQEGQQNKSSVLETLATPDFEKSNPATDSEALKTIILIQAKQLYWIRIIGFIILGAWLVNVLQSCNRR